MSESISNTSQNVNLNLNFDDYNSKTNITNLEASDDFYDVSDHRANGVSSKSAFCHLLKGSLGSGILAMPMAFSNAGFIFGSLATIIIGFLCTHCIHILVKCSQSLCRDLRISALNYEETAYEAFKNGPKPVRKFAKIAYDFIDIGMICTYYGGSGVYIVFIGTSFHDVINHNFDVNLDNRVYIALTVIPALMITQVHNLKYLVPFSAIANIFIFVVFGIILHYMFNAPLDFSNKYLVAPISKIPLFIATAVFALEGIGTVLPVENSMKRPETFLGCPGVLNMSMGLVLFFYGVMGFLGYLRFGSTIRGSITLNLPEGEILADAGKLLMAVAILFTYALQMYVPNKQFLNRIRHKFNEKTGNRNKRLIISIMSLFTGILAIVIPDLDPFITLLGSIFFSIVGFIAPVAIETIYLWPNMGFWNWRLIKNILIFFFAIFAMISGTVTSTKQIISIYL